MIHTNYDDMAGCECKICVDLREKIAVHDDLKDKCAGHKKSCKCADCMKIDIAAQDATVSSMRRSIFSEVSYQMAGDNRAAASLRRMWGFLVSAPSIELFNGRGKSFNMRHWLHVATSGIT